MRLIDYILLLTGLFGAELLYLRIARQIGIVDKPNQRSAHASSTIIRGGGILFWLTAFVAFVYGGYQFPYAFLGLSVVALVSFLDDLNTLPKRYRLSGQVVGIALLFVQTGVSPASGWLVGLLLVIGVGILNAYNFMDGINGLTAFYSLVTIGTLWYGQCQGLTDGPARLPADNVLLPFMFTAVLVFSYFNARRQAICFAGDVGSVSMGFVVLYALIQFINARQTYLPVCFLAVYGVDCVLTLAHRLYLGQNIFRAHRLHLYQLLVHEQGWPHLRVAALYALVQGGINRIVWSFLREPYRVQCQAGLVMLALLAGVYVVVKHQLLKPTKKAGSSNRPEQKIG